MHLMSIEDFRKNKYNSNKTDVINQHYVCQSIQKLFSDSTKSDKLVTCFFRGYKDKNDLKKVKELSTKKVMRLDNGYEIYNNYPNLLEQYFGYYENLFAPKIKSVIESIENNYSYKSFKSFVFDNLEIFLLFYFRASYTMEYFTHKRNKITNQEELDYKIIKERIENVLGDIRQIKLLSESIKIVYGEPILMVSGKREFLLSDTYFSTWSNKRYSDSFSNREIGFFDTNILIPLSSKYYILFSNDLRWQNKKKIKIYDKDINLFNSIIFRNCVKYCIGNKNCIKEIIKKLPNVKPSFMYTNGITLNKGFSKAHIFEDCYKDDVVYSIITREELNQLKLVKNTFIEFFYNIVSCEVVDSVVEKIRKEEINNLFTLEIPKYVRSKDC